MTDTYDSVAPADALPEVIDPLETEVIAGGDTYVVDPDPLVASGIEPGTPMEYTLPDPPEAASVLTPRVPLEADMRAVCDAYVRNELVLAEGKSLTAHAIAAGIGALRGTPPPSTGAVAAALARWEKVGYVTLKAKPVAFDDYTPEGRSEGLAALKAKHHAGVMAKRAAERTAAKLTSGVAPRATPDPAFVPPTPSF